MDPPESQVKPPPPDLRRSFTASPEKAYGRPLHTRTSSSAAATSKKMPRYNLADTARPSDVNIFKSLDEHVAAVERLSKGDHCFILRSDFSFTYALVIKNEVGGMLEVQVTEEGGTKSIPKGHWGKYIRTLNDADDSPSTQHPAGHLDEKRRHREGRHHSKKVGSHHGRRSTHEERPSRHNGPVTSTGSKTPVSKKEGEASFTHSTPNLYYDEGHYKGHQSEYIRQRRNRSPSGSDESPGLDDAIESSLPMLPFTKDYRRTASQPNVNVSIKEQQAARSRRRVTVSEKPLKYPSIPTKEFKRSVSIQTGDIPLTKCLEKGHFKRSQSESRQHRKHESSESDDSSSSSLNTSLSFDSIDDSSLRAQEDLNKLLSKSMPSLKQGIKPETSLRGAFGDVTEIEILD